MYTVYVYYNVIIRTEFVGDKSVQLQQLSRAVRLANLATVT